MRRILASALVVSLILVVMPNLAIAAINSGADCKRVGQSAVFSGKTFTCIKTGKKLVWNKGITLKKPKPTSTFPNIVFPLHNVGTGICDVESGYVQELHADSSYVKTTKSYSTLWQKYNISKPTSWDAIDKLATTSFGSYVAVKKQSSPEVHISVEPGIADDATMSKLYRELVAVSDLLGSGVEYPAFRKSVFMVVFKDWDWLKDEYLSLGCDPITAVRKSTNNMGAAAGWANSPTLETIFNLGSAGFNINGKFSGANLGILGGHEFFHLIQGQDIFLLSNGGDVVMPGWIYEGGPSLVGEFVSNYLKIAPFDTRYAATTVSSYGEGRLLNLEDSDGTTFIYPLGMLGAEFLVSIVGFESFVNIWKEAGKGKKFPDAFQDATGIELVDFYRMFYQIRPIMNLQQG